MKKIIFLAVFLVALIAVACSGNGKETSNADSCQTPLNPNGDSQLALLMRQLSTWNDTLKSKLQKRALTAEEMRLPDNIQTIHTAERTDKKIDKDLFKSMADFYLAQSEQFSNAGTQQADQVKYFNAMVRACVSCHENFCNGPIVRINKMFVPEAPAN
jgi:cytochrome c553